MALLILFFLVCKADAASFSDEVSSAIPNNWAYHTIRWQVDDASGITAGESFLISFNSSFSLANIEIDNINLTVNGISRNLIGACGAGTDIAANITGSEIDFLLCPASAAINQNDQISVQIGDSVDNAHKVRNASLPGGYYIDMVGESGYSDSARSEIIISAGSTTSFNIAPLTGNLILSGRSSPGSIIFVYEGDSLIGTDYADSSGNFNKTLSGLSLGIHNIGLWSRDTNGNNSEVLDYQFNINQAQNTQISGIMIPPTSSLEANSVKRSAPLWLNGLTFSSGRVNISIASIKDNINNDYQADNSGIFTANINPKLHLGTKNYSIIAYDGYGGVSQATDMKSYEVVRTSDINNDGNINIKDLDLYKEDYTIKDFKNVLNDINDDGGCNLSDLSIMMYDWSK